MEEGGEAQLPVASAWRGTVGDGGATRRLWWWGSGAEREKGEKKGIGGAEGLGGLGFSRKAARWL
jgi:hypothetical protein